MSLLRSLLQSKGKEREERGYICVHFWTVHSQESNPPTGLSMYREPRGLIPKSFLQREGVLDRRGVGEGFWLFVWRRWVKVCHEVRHQASILETSALFLQLVHCFHQPITQRRILPVKWIDRMRGKAATGFVCRLLGRMQTNNLSLPSVSAAADDTRNIQWGYSSAG